MFGRRGDLGQSSPGGARSDDSFAQRPDADDEIGLEVVQGLLGGLPRVFARIRDQGHGEDERSDLRVVALGLALPDGGAATVEVGGNGFGRWGSAERAAWVLGGECVWLRGA
ncbi:hypothetical protein Sru01_41770 [Sphaerisporangium rufum]|uniref:Uncharacterized protein n=1 Tax=Sphaerisporangium rufum TaxID=1381558 RepID=A0A919R6J3_9ACTN|nr:hypothetical protein Sru01_41770 [Sphaerisporangium rufum]